MESNNELFSGNTSQVNCLKGEILFVRLFKELLNMVHGHSRGRDRYDSPEEKKLSIKTMGVLFKKFAITLKEYGNRLCCRPGSKVQFLKQQINLKWQCFGKGNVK